MSFPRTGESRSAEPSLRRPSARFLPQTLVVAGRDEFEGGAEFTAALHEIVIGLQAEKEAGREAEMARQAQIGVCGDWLARRERSPTGSNPAAARTPRTDLPGVVAEFDERSCRVERLIRRLRPPAP